ncbi:hypothetical protein H671_8g18891 [Cricetulus griseus]|nr:hypothetical protein H671_8g18891 [Cricetulus griseus]
MDLMDAVHPESWLEDVSECHSMVLTFPLVRTQKKTTCDIAQGSHPSSVLDSESRDVEAITASSEWSGLSYSWLVTEMVAIWEEFWSKTNEQHFGDAAFDTAKMQW